MWSGVLVVKKFKDSTPPRKQNELSSYSDVGQSPSRFNSIDVHVLEITVFLVCAYSSLLLWRRHSSSPHKEYSRSQAVLWLSELCQISLDVAVLPFPLEHLIRCLLNYTHSWVNVISLGTHFSNEMLPRLYFLP